MRINLLSSPRNVSTALMYSFAQRADMSVIDEPFYAYYLSRFGVDHPGGDDILANLPRTLNGVFESIEQAHVCDHLFIKGMAHHLMDTDLNCFDTMKHVLLIRNPKQLIASFAQVIPNPSMRDIGVAFQHELYKHLVARNLEVIVLDSGTLLAHPKRCLAALCAALGLTFDERMLSWPQGAIAEDGIWAEYWYANVHKSTCFEAPATSKRALPLSCEALYQEALPHYKALTRVALCAEST